MTIVPPISPPVESKKPLKGPAALVIAIAVVGLVLIFEPAYRLFFGISVGIGVVVAGILYLWNKYRPIKEADVNSKHPLGLG